MACTHVNSIDMHDGDSVTLFHLTGKGKTSAIIQVKINNLGKIEIVVSGQPIDGDLVKVTEG